VREVVRRINVICEGNPEAAAYMPAPIL